MKFDHLEYNPEAPVLKFIEKIDGIIVNRLEFTNRCIPIEPDYTLAPIFNIIWDFLESENKLELIFKFSALNTKSVRMFMRFFNKLNEIKSKDFKKSISIIWLSPTIDEDMQELGELYRDYSNNLAKKGKYRKIYFKLKTYNYV